MEIGNVTIHAELECSVSHGTLRTEDLVPVFMDVLKDTPEYEELKSQYDAIIDKYRFSGMYVWDTFEMYEFFSEDIFGVLNKYAPEGYLFDSHPGDGSDFGYWKVEEDEDEEPEGAVKPNKDGKYVYVMQ